MPRATYRMCKYCGAWHDVANWPDNHRDPAPQRSMLSRPSIRADGMGQDVWNPVDGKYYDSRSAYERVVKENGCEIIGNDDGHWGKAGKTSVEPQGVRDDIVQSWKQLSG